MIAEIDTVIRQIEGMTEMDFAAFLEQLHEVVTRNNWRGVIDRQFNEVKVKGVDDKSIDIKRLIESLEDARWQASSAESDLDDAVDKLKKILKDKK